MPPSDVAKVGVCCKAAIPPRSSREKPDPKKTTTITYPRTRPLVLLALRDQALESTNEGNFIYDTVERGRSAFLLGEPSDTGSGPLGTTVCTNLANKSHLLNVKGYAFETNVSLHPANSSSQKEKTHYLDFQLGP